MVNALRELRESKAAAPTKLTTQAHLLQTGTEDYDGICCLRKHASVFCLGELSERITKETHSANR